MASFNTLGMSQQQIDRADHVARRDALVKKLATAHANQMQSAANYENDKNATDVQTTGMNNDTEMLKQKLANTGAQSLANTNNAAEMDRTRLQGSNALEIQRSGDKSAAERLATQESGQNSRLATMGDQKTKEQNMALAGNALLAGTGGDQAQQIADGANDGKAAFLAGVTVPQKSESGGFEYIKPTVNPLTGQQVSPSGVFDKRSGVLNSQQSPSGGTLETHAAALSQMPDVNKQRQYLQSLKTIDPAMYEQLRQYYAGEAQQ
jgi:hypothetical protein